MFKIPGMQMIYSEWLGSAIAYAIVSHDPSSGIAMGGASAVASGFILLIISFFYQR